MRSSIRLLATAMFLCAGIGVVGAQTKGQGASPAPDQGPAQNDQLHPNVPGGNGTEQQPQSGSSAPPGTLSHELNRSGGVIAPPTTGGGGVVPPPNQGTSATPVIPPPGSPGGNQQVQPK